MTVLIRSRYRIGVDEPERYVERLNTDATGYGGNGQGIGGAVEAREEHEHRRSCSLAPTLPPPGVLARARLLIIAGGTRASADASLVTEPLTRTDPRT